jgi:hypothetical protein
MATTDHRPCAGRPGAQPAGSPLAVRLQVRLLSGPAGRALAGAQGVALADLLAFLGLVEVGGSEEDEP